MITAPPWRKETWQTLVFLVIPQTSHNWDDSKIHWIKTRPWKSGHSLLPNCVAHAKFFRHHRAWMRRTIVIFPGWEEQLWHFGAVASFLYQWSLQNHSIALDSRTVSPPSAWQQPWKRKLRYKGKSLCSTLHQQGLAVWKSAKWSCEQGLRGSSSQGPATDL